MMNEREILILQIKQGTGEWEDITKQVQWFDAKKNACRIKYVGNANFYWKSWRDLIIYNKPVIVEATGKIVYCDKVPVKGVYQIMICTPKVGHFWRCIFLYQGRRKIMQSIA